MHKERRKNVQLKFASRYEFKFRCFSAHKNRRGSPRIDNLINSNLCNWNFVYVENSSAPIEFRYLALPFVSTLEMKYVYRSMNWCTNFILYNHLAWIWSIIRMVSAFCRRLLVVYLQRFVLRRSYFPPAIYIHTHLVRPHNIYQVLVDKVARHTLNWCQWLVCKKLKNDRKIYTQTCFSKSTIHHFQENVSIVWVIAIFPPIFACGIIFNNAAF